MRAPARPRTVFLIGFMGSGKSAVGRILARRLGRRFVDTDREVERAAGSTVAELFARRGEQAFRRLEAAALRRAASVRGAVVSVGGGAVKRPSNVALMRRRGLVLHLAAPLRTLWQRARRDGLSKRPLLEGGGLERMGKLLRERMPLYAKARHIRIDAVGRPAAVASKVLEALRRVSSPNEV